jgi:hypothetical protein
VPERDPGEWATAPATAWRRTRAVHRIRAIGTYHPGTLRRETRVRFGRRRGRAELSDLHDEVTRLRTEMRRSIDDVQVAFSERDTELARALRRVADACHVVAGRIEGERVERAALIDVVTRVSASVTASLAQLPALASPPRHQVIGGSIDPETVLDDHPVNAADAADVADVADVTPEVLRHESVEVHCRFGDRWVGGFEVVDVVPSDGCAVYRLRRRSDDSVLPTLFDERDIRFRVSLVDR